MYSIENFQDLVLSLQSTITKMLNDDQIAAGKCIYLAFKNGAENPVQKFHEIARKNEKTRQLADSFLGHIKRQNFKEGNINSLSQRREFVLKSKIWTSRN